MIRREAWIDGVTGCLFAGPFLLYEGDPATMAHWLEGVRYMIEHEGLEKPLARGLMSREPLFPLLGLVFSTRLKGERPIGHAWDWNLLAGEYTMSEIPPLVSRCGVLSVPYDNGPGRLSAVQIRLCPVPHVTGPGWILYDASGQVDFSRRE